MSILRRSLATVSVVCISTAGILAAATGPVRADEPVRTASVSQATDLTTQVVQISWTGFRPTRRNTGQFAVNVVQCAEVPTSLADCYTKQSYPNPENGTQVTGAVTRSDGTGSTAIEVRGAADLPDLGCNAARPCSLLAYEVTGLPIPIDALPPEHALATIRFAPSPADCPAVTDFDARTGGEPSAVPLLYRVAGAECTAPGGAIIDVAETSSNEARDATLAADTDFGLTSLPADPAELAAHPDVLRTAYAPIDLTAVAIGFNMRDPRTGQPITDITLTPRLVARIISDSRLDTFFSDPELRALNPGINWPAFAVSPPLLRAEANADTTIITRWLQEDPKARALLDGNDSGGVQVNSAWRGITYPTSVFESRSATGSYLPRTGEREIARRLFYGVRPSEFLPDSPDYFGFVGVLDLAAAKRYGISVAKIVNGAGQPIAPTPDSILAGYRAMDQRPDGTRTANYAATDPAAYPMVKVDYAMVTNRLRTDRVAVVERVVNRIASTPQASLPAGYVELPPAEQARAAAVTAKLTSLITGIDPAANTSNDTYGGGSTYDSGSSYTYDSGYDTTGTGDGGAGGTAAVAPLVHRGLVRFQPVVALSDPRRTSGLVIVLVLGVIAGLAALAPSAWSGVRRLLHR